MPENILIVAPSWVGDCVMTQPLLVLLKRRFPDARLTAFAPKWSLAVMKRMPEVDDFIENPFGHGVLKLWQRYRLGKSLRARAFTRALVLPGSAKSALVPFFAKIPVRTGFLGEMRRGLLNDVRILDETGLPRMVDRFAALAYPPATDPLPATPLPRLDSDPEAGKGSLKTFALATDLPVVALCPGAEYGPAKRWPARHFRTLAQYLIAQGNRVWLFGSAKDAAIAAEIAADNAQCINLCGKTELDQAIDLLALCRAVVCNDSGLMHVAAALGRPVVALYGSSSPDHTPPLSERAKILTLNLSCSPCFERDCPLGHTDCLQRLLPQRVIEALDLFRAS